jgi:hypothetical protein
MTTKVKISTLTDINTNKLLGRATAGTGAIEEITLGTGLSYTGTTLNASNSFLSNATNSTQDGYFTGVRLLESAGATYYTRLVSGSDLSGPRTLTFATGDADRTLTISGNVTLAGASTATFTTALTVNTGAVTLSGNASGSSVTLPASGTLVNTSQTFYIGSTAITVAQGTGTITALAGVTSVNGTTIPATATLLTSGGALGTPSSGTLTNCTFPTLNQSTTGSAATFTSTTQNSQFNSVGVGTAGSGTAGEIRATNNITAYYSDERLKKKLGNIENALDKLLQINCFYYEANETAQKLGYLPIREVGVSAQSVERVMPEVVAPAPIDEQYLTVRYERLVPLIIEAIRDLKNEIEVLKGKGL